MQKKDLKGVKEEFVQMTSEIVVVFRFFEEFFPKKDFGGLQRLRASDESTTETLESAIAAPAIQGGNKSLT